MARKRWAPVADATDSVVKLREKKKWQIALRRYVVEMSPCYEYAPYFGLSITDIRAWFEAQFNPSMTWDNFGTAWQFAHIVSPHHFDWNQPAELQLCWNFTNLKAESTNHATSTDPIGYAKNYFSALASTSDYPLTRSMLAKIATLTPPAPSLDKQISFINARESYLTELSQLDPQAFAQLNSGQSPGDLIKEITLLKKYST
ncbi:MAG: hypothetical protein KGO82_02285 [Bacteroidota bacterium]|nr:hypothetical protein [Bacteroidota bacterium]